MTLAQARTKQTVRKPTKKVDLLDEDQGEHSENEAVSQGEGTDKPKEQKLGEGIGGAVEGAAR